MALKMPLTTTNMENAPAVGEGNLIIMHWPFDILMDRGGGVGRYFLPKMSPLPIFDQNILNAKKHYKAMQQTKIVHNLFFNHKLILKIYLLPQNVKWLLP